jgi:hypothetical protein
MSVELLDETKNREEAVTLFFEDECFINDQI